MWTVTAPEEPVTHVNEAGASVAGPSEVGLIQSLNDSGLMDSDEEESSSNEIAGDPRIGEVTLSEQANARAENLKKALERLEAIRNQEGPLVKAPLAKVPPRAYEEECQLCRKAEVSRTRHSLGDCPQFLTLGISDRERAAAEYACGICLEVEHYISNCPYSLRECGVYGCKLQHHPLLHRLQYVEPLAPQDDETFNWPRHQQARQDGAEKFLKCAICQDQHDTKMCRAWRKSGGDKIHNAVKKWICVKCLRGEHGYCPAEQIICGVNRCVEHHDPFFHKEKPRDLTWELYETNDCWGDLLKAHQEKVANRDAAYQTLRLNAQHERVRTIEQLSAGFTMAKRYGGGRGRMPPYSLRRNQTGEIVMNDTTYRMLAKSYQEAGEMARGLDQNTVRHLLLNMDKGVRLDLMAGEFKMARNDPRRLQAIVKGPGETEESYIFRSAKRALALELYPPASARQLSEQQDLETRETDPEDGSGEEESGSSSSNEHEGSGVPIAGPSPVAGLIGHLRRRAQITRLVLSGNPQEGEPLEDPPELA